MSDIFALAPDTLAFVNEIKQKKYMQKGELSWGDTLERVTRTFFPNMREAGHKDVGHSVLFHHLLASKVITPAGRILAGAGTERNVTMFNCFISPLLQDSMRSNPGKPGKGIMDALADVAYSMQMGGGVGTDFSPLRPDGALVQRLHAFASGPLAFMDMWDAMCRSVMSAGDRRGAMMATLLCDHPDIMAFITAKHDPQRLRMFNVSVLVTDAFMEAVALDQDWELGHWSPPFEREPIRHASKDDPYTKSNRPWYVYEVVKARKIWDAIMRSTYDHAEPGVIFIDRVNQMNNLRYYEHIQATNPCFTGDTLVCTAEGPKTFLELLGREPLVLTTAPNATHEAYVYRKMTNIRCTQKNVPIVEITLQSHSRGNVRVEEIKLRCTPNHIFYLENRAEIRAGDLIAGMRLQSIISSYKVAAVEFLSIRENVYCGEVEGTHQFFIHPGVLVHNCGEQAMAPDNTCNLWHVNLSRCIKGTPFTDDCRVDYDLIRRATKMLVRAGDRLIDLSLYPTQAQEKASKDRRRIGIGITGLGNLFMFQRVRYGSAEAIDLAEKVMQTICFAAYEESADLAQALGSFPVYEENGYLNSEFILDRLPEPLQNKIKTQGIRNALLLSVAPTGTTSIGPCDNASGGLEPVFALRYNRQVLERDGSFSNHSIEDLGFRVFANVFHGGDADAAFAHAQHEDYMATAESLAPIDHLRIQAAIQKWVDNSVSKTINVPTDIAFNDFKEIYIKAYEMNCKGCTTYRPNPESGRGVVLSVDQPKVEQTKTDTITTRDETRKRPDVLEGRTYRLRWGGLPFPMFFTINDELHPDGSRVPFEVFINSKAVENNHWVSALTRMISAVMRKGGDLTFIPDELKQVWSARGGEFHNQAFVPSEVALIGQTLERHFREIGYLKGIDPDSGPTPPGAVYAEAGIGEQCPSCGALQVIREQGCKRCIACGWSNCG